MLGRNPTSSRSPTPRRRFKEFKFKYGISSGSSRSSNGIKSCSKTINSCKSAFFLTYSLFGRLCSKPRPSLRNKNHHMAKVPSRGQKSGSIKNSVGYHFSRFIKWIKLTQLQNFGISEIFAHSYMWDHCNLQDMIQAISYRTLHASYHMVHMHLRNSLGLISNDFTIP